MEQFAVRNVDEPEQARNDMKIPEEIGIESDIFEEKREKVTSKRDPVVRTGRGEIGHIDAGLRDFRVGDAVSLDKETGDLQEEDEEQCDAIFFLISELNGS